MRRPRLGRRAARTPAQDSSPTCVRPSRPRAPPRPCSVGPELASRMARVCPHLVGTRPEAVKAALRAVQDGLGAADAREAAALVASQPEALRQSPEDVASAAAGVVAACEGDAAMARALVGGQPTLLLVPGGAMEGAVGGHRAAQAIRPRPCLGSPAGPSRGGPGQPPRGPAPSTRPRGALTSLSVPHARHRETPRPGKLRQLGRILGLPSAAGGRQQLLAACAVAPNLLTRSPQALRASWDALAGAYGEEAARQLLTGGGGEGGEGGEGGGGGGQPRLLAYSAAALASRAAALEGLAALSEGWRSLVAAARAEPARLAALLAAPEAGAARLRWLVASEQRLAPGGTSLQDVASMSDAAFCDIFPLWRAHAPAAAP
jgi:hypothetical protein